MASRNLADHVSFKKALQDSKNIIALTGAGVSAESGIGTFRGPTGIWRKYQATSLASPSAFAANPALVWEFYHWRREVAFKAKPNNAHLALAKYQDKCKREGRSFRVITQNVDGLHVRAGSEDVLEIHGALHKVICTVCKNIEINTNSPICEVFEGRGDPNAKDADLPIIPATSLPKCAKCSGLLRPYIVWFGENLDQTILASCYDLLDKCDLLLVIGTSSVVYPAASFAPYVLEKSKLVAEFNIDDIPASDMFQFYFSGMCGTTLPKALGIEI